MRSSVPRSPGCASDASPPAAADDPDDFSDVGPAARNEAGAVVSKEAVECVSPVGRMPCGHERVSDQGPTDATATRRWRCRQERLDIDRAAERRESPGNLPHARRCARKRCYPRNVSQRSVVGIEEISEHMDVTSGVDGGNLDAVNQPEHRGSPQPSALRRDPATVS